MRRLLALAAFLLVTTPAQGSQVVSEYEVSDHNLILGVSRSRKWAEVMVQRWKDMPRKKCGRAKVVLVSHPVEGMEGITLFWPLVDSHPVTNVECARTFYRRWLSKDRDMGKGYPSQTFHAMSFRGPEDAAPYPDEENDP